MSKQHSTTKIEFGKRLANVRKAAGYTQQQLADEISVSRRMIAYYEAESDHPPASLLVDLAKALNLSSEKLLGLTEIKPIKQGIMAQSWTGAILDRRNPGQAQSWTGAILDRRNPGQAQSWPSRCRPSENHDLIYAELPSRRAWAGPVLHRAHSTWWGG